jgi:hypothetical protein
MREIKRRSDEQEERRREIEAKYSAPRRGNMTSAERKGPEGREVKQPPQPYPSNHIRGNLPLISSYSPPPESPPYVPSTPPSSPPAEQVDLTGYDNDDDQEEEQGEDINENQADQADEDHDSPVIQQPELEVREEDKKDDDPTLSVDGFVRNQARREQKRLEDEEMDRQIAIAIEESKVQDEIDRRSRDQERMIGQLWDEKMRQVRMHMRNNNNRWPPKEKRYIA